MVICALITIPKDLAQKIGRNGNLMKNEELPDNNSVKIGKNFEKSLEVLKGIFVPKTQVKNHHLILVLKTRIIIIIIIIMSRW